MRLSRLENTSGISVARIDPFSNEALEMLEPAVSTTNCNWSPEPVKDLFPPPEASTRNLISPVPEMKFAGDICVFVTVTSLWPTDLESICVQEAVDQLYRYTVCVLPLREYFPSYVVVNFVTELGACAIVTLPYQSVKRVDPLVVEFTT